LRFFCLIFVLLSITTLGQDKVYLLNGDCQTGKVTDITSDVVSFENDDGNISVNRDKILLIEYSNGIIEKFNAPEQNVIYMAPNEQSKKKGPDHDLSHHNQFSLNTLALCNADIAFFYERLNKTKKMGYGFMGAYNFNPYATLPNVFISILYNAKKNYDIGAHFNLYPGRFENRTGFYFGMMVKYTDFSFTKVEEVVSNTGGITSITTKFTPAKGKQLATIFTAGTHTDITKNFFIKTLIGLGGFSLKGAYRQQFNYILNQDNPKGTAPLNVGFLLKLYVGINVGFNF
jgi:hypothetical protein